MLRGYRLFILALGLILSAAGPPNSGNGQNPPKDSSKQVEGPLQSIAASLQEANKPSNLTQPCDENDDHRDSDLCAQWKAADAARSAANAAWVFGTIGTLIGALTLIAASAAAFFAKKAADHTETAANAAADAVTETRRIGEAQVRAYLTIEKLECRRARDGVSFKATVRNSGNSPALAVQIIIKVVHRDGTKSIIEPLEEHTVGAQSIGELAECFWLYDASIGKKTILAEVAIGYADVFSGLHKIGDRFACLPKDLLSTYVQMQPGRDVASYIRASQSNSPTDAAT
jgi:hypothetical protein